MSSQEPERIDHDVRSIGDHFIPVSRKDLMHRLCEIIEGDGGRGAEAFQRFVSALEIRLHDEFRAELRRLDEDYAPFDPDRLLVSLEREGEASLGRRRQRFFENLEEVLRKANYRRLEHREIEEAIKAAKALGIRLAVDFDGYAHLAVWVRGSYVDRWTVRRWWRAYRRETIEVPVHRRLILVFQQVRESGDAAHEPITLKIFKNIPVSDVDLLLPTSRVQFTWIDRGRILLPTLSGLGLTLFKIVKTSVSVMLFSGFYGLLALATLIIGSLGYSLRSVFGYLATKDKYQLHLTRHLYYQNLGNNIGVLLRLAHDAEEQECREAVMAYWLLWHEARGEAWTKERVDRRAESLLRQWLGVGVDFEDDDALAKLYRFGVAETDGMRWRAVEPEEAIARLERGFARSSPPEQPLPETHSTLTE